MLGGLLVTQPGQWAGETAKRVTSLGRGVLCFSPVWEIGPLPGITDPSLSPEVFVGLMWISAF